ncbi:hypothetical protein Tco_1288775 [Tanacetum coccineum]
MYYNKHLDYVYLLWEDFMFQVENKDSKKNNDMFYPRFTKVIIDYFMAKDPSISRRNKMFWHTARDDSMFTTICAYATGEKTPKPKKKKADSESSPKEKPAQALKGKSLKTSSMADQSTKEKQPAIKSKAIGLTVLSKVALIEDEQMKLATKRIRIQTHSSHASGSGNGVDTLSKVPDEKLQKKSGTDERAGDKPKVPDVPKYNSDSEEESWTFSDGDDDDDVNEESDAHDDSDENESDDEGDDFVYPNSSTYTPDDQDNEENVEDQEKAEDDKDIEEYDDEEMLYGDLNLNRERIDAGMIEAHETKDTSSTHLRMKGVTLLESELSMLKQSNPFAEAISSIPGIVDKYLATKMKEAVNVAVQLKGHSDEDKDEEPSAGSNRGTKRRRSGKETELSNKPTHKESSITSSSRGASRSQSTDLDDSTHQEFNTRDEDVTPTREAQDERTPYPHDLSKPLPLIPNARGRLVIPFDHFINNDLEYLKGGSLSHKYTTSITKTKAADYGQIKWIKDMIPRSMWSIVPVVYDKHAYWGTYHWGPKHQRFYGYATNMETSKYVYSKHRILAVISLKIMKFYGYSHLEEITVRQQDDKLYKFKKATSRDFDAKTLKTCYYFLFKAS